MNHTVEYLQSDAAEAEIEIEVLVENLLRDAVESGASDLHVEPWENTVAVRLRLNGVLTELVYLPGLSVLCVGT